MYPIVQHGVTRIHGSTNVHQECDGTTVESMKLRPDNDVQETHFGTMDPTHNSRDYDLCLNKLKNNKKFTSVNATQFTAANCVRICLSFSTHQISDSSLDCKSGKY